MHFLSVSTLPMNLFLFLFSFVSFHFFCSLPRKKTQHCELNEKTWFERRSLRSFSGRPKKTLRRCSRHSENFSLHKIKISRWSSMSKLFKFPSHIWTWTSRYMNMKTMLKFQHSDWFHCVTFSLSLSSSNFDSNLLDSPVSNLSLWYEFMFILLFFFDFLDREISREWIFDAHRL